MTHYPRGIRGDGQYLFILISCNCFPVINVLFREKFIVLSFCVHLTCLGLTLETLALLYYVISKLIVNYRCLSFIALMSLYPNRLWLWKVVFIFLRSKFIVKDCLIHVWDHVWRLHKWEGEA